jgi:hypothetical protein
MSTRQLLIYIPSPGGSGSEEALLQSIVSRAPLQDATIFRSFDGFRSRLLRPSEVDDVVLIVPAREEDLFRAIEVSDLLRDNAVVVALPAALSHATDLAFRLRPRLVAFLDDSREVIAAVVENLARAA